MDLATQHVLPFLLVLGRVAAFFSIMPIWSIKSVPMQVRAGLAILVSAAYTAALGPIDGGLPTEWLDLSLLLVHEILCGLGLGLAVAIVFSAIQQTGEIIHTQMGLADAEIVDPLTGGEPLPVGLIFEMAFLVLFLVADGHLLLLQLIERSYTAFPIGHPPSAAVMAETIISAGSLMLTFGLQLAAPVLAGFLLLAALLAVLARAMPEINILTESFPLRVGLGMLLSAALVPALGGFTQDLSGWLAGFVAA
jgi:flagellar biosynthesis protein FliR